MESSILATAPNTTLITGPTGFVGRALVGHLLAAGRNVRTARRSRSSDGPGSVQSVVVGDLTDCPDWSVALEGVNVVIHCAARAHVLKDDATDPLEAFRIVNTKATLHLAGEAARAGARRFVFISSIGVNGSETRGRPFRHDDQPDPHSPYAVSKYEAEQGLNALAAETGMEVVIIRAPLVVGPNPKGNLAVLETAISKGLPLPFGAARRNRRDFVSIDNLCSLITTCADHPGAAGQTFLASDGQAIPTRTLVERMAAQSGKTVKLVAFPPAILATALGMIGKRGLASQLFGDLELDISHTERTLGWAPQPVT